MFSPEEIAYLEKRKPKRLSYSIPEEASLFQTIHGAHTISRAIELDAISSAFLKKQNEFLKTRPKTERPEVSWEMGVQNEQCIEKYGCSMYQFW